MMEKSYPKTAVKPHIPIYAVDPDMFTPYSFNLPRLVMGAFTMLLKHIYFKLFNEKLEIFQYGKPYKLTYDFVKKHIKYHAENNNIEITNFYMIGDNPRSDIKGGNDNGFTTFLVRTGVFQGEKNDKTNPANYVVKDFNEAIKKIFELENL